MDEPRKSSHFLLKIFGSVFALVIAPLFVTFLTKIVIPETPQLPGGGSPNYSLLDKDLSKFQTYLGAVPRSDKPAYGLGNDPERIFRIEDGQLHIMGKIHGGLVTKDSYDNYKLTVEFRWAHKTSSDDTTPRHAGILLHALGIPSSDNHWLIPGIRCGIGEGDTGALRILDRDSHRYQFEAPTETVPALRKGAFDTIYKPGGSKTINKSLTVRSLGFRPDPKKNPAHERDLPIGEWNVLECVCQGDEITIHYNGDRVVNHAFKVTPSRGKISFECLGSEIIFRTINLMPLPPQAVSSSTTSAPTVTPSPSTTPATKKTPKPATKDTKSH